MCDEHHKHADTHTGRVAWSAGFWLLLSLPFVKTLMACVALGGAGAAQGERAARHCTCANTTSCTRLAALRMLDSHVMPESPDRQHELLQPTFTPESISGLQWASERAWLPTQSVQNSCWQSRQ